MPTRRVEARSSEGEKKMDSMGGENGVGDASEEGRRLPSWIPRRRGKMRGKCRAAVHIGVELDRLGKGRVARWSSKDDDDKMLTTKG